MPPNGSKWRFSLWFRFQTNQKKVRAAVVAFVERVVPGFIEVGFGCDSFVGRSADICRHSGVGNWNSARFYLNRLSFLLGGVSSRRLEALWRMSCGLRAASEVLVASLRLGWDGWGA